MLSPMKSIFAAAAALGISSAALAADPLVADLRGRLANAGVADVNAQLSANWDTKMARLGRLVRRCDLDAMSLSVDLLSTTNLEALQGHVYSLELAMRKCPERLLPIVPPEHVKSLCAVDSYAEAHPSAKLTDELDRRVARLRKSDRLAASPNGQVCIEAYASAKQRLQ